MYMETIGNKKRKYHMKQLCADGLVVILNQNDRKTSY